MRDHLKFAASLFTLFKEHPLAERFGAAARAGFSAVEVQFPYEIPLASVRNLPVSEGLRVVLINTPADNWHQGSRGVAALPGRRAQFRKDFSRAIDYAVQLNCPAIHVLSGTLAHGTDRNHAQSTFIENLTWACDKTAAQGITILIEPINANDIPGYFLDNFDTARHIIDTVGRENLRLQFDVYHCRAMGHDPVASLQQYANLIGHVQIADFPGRHEPGTGDIAFDDVFAIIARSLPSVWIGCEYHPLTQTHKSFDWMSI